MYQGAFFRLKACPRCGGDILVDKVFEDDDVCIQCGFRKFRSVTCNVCPQKQLEKTVIVANGQVDSKVKVKEKL